MTLFSKISNIHRSGENSTTPFVPITQLAMQRRPNFLMSLSLFLRFKNWDNDLLLERIL